MSAYYNENEPYAAQWLRNLIKAGHIAGGDVDERSIIEVKASDLKGYDQCHFFAGIGVWSYALRCAGWADDRRVWTGSCPCQSFSVAGKGQGFADERHLWPVWAKLIGQCRPDVIFGEQVASSAALVWLDAVYTDLEDQGYAVGAIDLCATSVGAPHIRQRLFWVAGAEGRGWREERQIFGRGVEGNHPQGHAPGSASGGDAGIVGHTGGSRSGRDTRTIPGQKTPSQQKRQRTKNRSIADESFVTSAPRRLGHAGGSRLSLGQRAPERFGAVRLEGAPAATAGAWADVEWWMCRDGKARPAESGTFPLADGITNRVGRIRAAGNALVAPVAEAFVKAYMGL